MNNKSAQTALFGSALLLIAVFALNILISTGLPGLRLDLTQDKLYSLSDGVSPLLRDLDEPVRLDFYYSKKSAENLPNFRTYVQRVEEFLEEMVQASNGKLSLRVLDPEPFSEAEDMARAALSRIQIDGAGRELTLGLIAANSVDEQSVIPYLDPTQERFLEYEVMRSVISIGRLGRPTVGLVTSLDMAPTLDQQTMQMRPGWQILSQVEQLFDVVPIAESDTELPEGLDLLWIVHPRSISPNWPWRSIHMCFRRSHCSCVWIRGVRRMPSLPSLHLECRGHSPPQVNLMPSWALGFELESWLFRGRS